MVITASYIRDVAGPVDAVGVIAWIERDYLGRPHTGRLNEANPWARVPRPAGELPEAFVRRLVAEWRMAGAPRTAGAEFTNFEDSEEEVRWRANAMFPMHNIPAPGRGRR